MSSHWGEVQGKKYRDIALLRNGKITKRLTKRNYTVEIFIIYENPVIYEMGFLGSYCKSDCDLLYSARHFGESQRLCASS